VIKVLRPTQHKIGHFGHVPQAKRSQSLGMARKNKTQHNRSTHSPIKRNVLQHKINTKKLKPGLVTSKRREPILVSVLHKSVTDLLTSTLTYLLTIPDPYRASKDSAHCRDADPC